jgi:hypothetical protein
MINLSKPRSSEFVLVVAIERTFSNEAILVNYTIHYNKQKHTDQE